MDGAETVTDVDAGLSVVVLLDASVDEPDADPVIDVALNPDTGPDPEGHTTSAVGVRHNCGESPIAEIVAAAVSAPETPVNVTAKSGD